MVANEDEEKLIISMEISELEQTEFDRLAMKGQKKKGIG